MFPVCSCESIKTFNLFFISWYRFSSVTSNPTYPFVIIKRVSPRHISSSLQTEGRFWNVSSRFYIEQIISHARESSRRANKAGALRYWIREDDELSNSPASPMHLAQRFEPAGELALFPRNRKKKHLISQTRRSGGHSGGGNLVFQRVYGGIRRWNLFIFQ